MPNGTVEKIMKSSLLSTYVITQPLAVYVDAYPALDNKMLLESEEMQYGEHGQIVRVVQQKLKTLSYYDDNVDGVYGVFTEYALKNFQKDRHMHKSGRLDEKTKKEMVQEEKQKHIDQLEHMSDSVQPDMHSDDVKIIQDALEYFGYYEGEIDGIYGPITQKGLEIAEDDHNIALTGEVTKTALQKLYDTEEMIEEENGVKQEEVEEQEISETDDAKQTDSDKDEAEQADKDQDEDQSDDVDQDEATQDKEAEEDDKDIKQAKVKKDVNAEVAEVAESLLGTPYEWGGETETGFDCSGFIQYVYDSQGITTPRTVSDIWNYGDEVDEPSVGDSVFFETYKPGPSHMGVYTGDGEFIHASESSGVKTSNLDDSYWEDRYLGAKRIQ